MDIDYELIDSGDGRRLERFGQFVLDRPDPEVLWKKGLSEDDWKKSDAKFDKKWILNPNSNNNVPDKWQINVGELKFWLKLSPFKHVGIFPEQLWQWNHISSLITKHKSPTTFLNLFAYTGVSTMVAANAGASVTHVDASRPAITWANENRDLNGMQGAPIRWMIDDALKFTEREIKRGNKYDAVIMDPPVYGHGPTGIPWDFAKDFPRLMSNVQKLMTKDPLFVLVNAYAVSTSPTTLGNTMLGYLGDLGGKVDNGELTLTEKSIGRTLSTGIWAMWSK